MVEVMDFYHCSHFCVEEAPHMTSFYSIFVLLLTQR